MPQQTTMWRFLKRDSSSLADIEMENSSAVLPPTPKRAKSSSTLHKDLVLSPPSPPLDDMFSEFYRPASVHTSSRTLSSPSLAKMDCDDSQMILDCGQKRIGPELCTVCGMVYSPVSSEDASLHERYHRHLASPPRFNRRLCSNGTFVCVQEYDDGFIYKCCFDGDGVRQNKNYQVSIEEMSEKMNEELGQETNRRVGCFASGSPSNSNFCFGKAGRQMYVFISRSCDLAVHGILIVDHVKFAFRYNADGLDEQPRDAAMGVNRIWTWAGARRRRIATRLVECARCNFFFGAPIMKKHVAFSDPTASGLEFAKQYCSANSILVYRFG